MKSLFRGYHKIRTPLCASLILAIAWLWNSITASGSPLFQATSPIYLPLALKSHISSPPPSSISRYINGLINPTKMY